MIPRYKERELEAAARAKKPRHCVVCGHHDRKCGAIVCMTRLKHVLIIWTAMAVFGMILAVTAP